MSTNLASLPTYDRFQTYDWNYDHAPRPVEVEVPAVPGEWSFLGRRVGSPLGVPAGPLLNGAWCLYYASLGFDVVTYKTVRSVERACYPLPNLQPVQCGQLAGSETEVPATEQMTGSWAVSYGMPSKSPDIWRRDIEATRRRLPEDKLLSVSVVGTIQDGWTIDDLADDYARCAAWAVESGADCIETNFSCPNVSTCDGQLYQQPADAARVAEVVRSRIGKTPYILKIGKMLGRDDAAALLESVAPHADALAMTNSIATTVRSLDGRTQLFGGERRGICGDATREASVAQTRLMHELIQQRGLQLELVGVGGASTAAHVRQYLDAGATAVHLATAAMVDPSVAIKIREELRENRK